MVAATVANGGVLMKPYLIDQVTASDLSVVDQTQPQELGQPISATVAGYEKQMMIAVVQDSDGTGAAFNPSARAAWRSPGRPGPPRTARASPTRTRFSPLSPPLTTRRSPSAS